MAGESPDKSKQKESSGETAESERDPRLAVFRDAPTKAKTPEGAAAVPADDTDGAEGPDVEGGPDAAEAVAKSDADEPGEKATAGGPGESTSGGAAKAKKPSGASKRSGAGKAAAAGAGGAREGSERPGAPERTDAPAQEGAEKRTSAESAPGEGAPAEGASVKGPGAAKGADAGAAKDSGSGPAAETGPEAAPADRGDADGKGSNAKGDERLKAAVAAWVAGEGTTDEEKGREGSESAPEGRSGAAQGASGSAGGDAPADEDREGSEGAEGRAEGKSPSRAASDAETGKPADQATAVFRTVDPKAKPAARAASDSEGASDSGDESAAEPSSGPEAGSTSKGSTPADDATRVFAAVKPEGLKRGSEKSRKEDSKGSAAKGSTEGADGSPSDSSSPSDSPEAKASVASDSATAEPVDQATTVFKAVRPNADDDSKGGKDAQGGKGPKGSQKESEPQKADSDKKTAAGDKADAGRNAGTGDKAGAGDKGDAPAERDAERTSQFIALKSTDAPSRPAKPAGRTAKAPGAIPPVPGKLSASGTSAGAGAAAGAQTTAEQPAAQPQADPGALPESERTKQQPLPPLDLLAQLTNTPPPPETPLRTVVRRFKIWTPLALLLILVFVVVQAVRPLPDPSLTLTGDATYSFDGSKPSMPWPDEGQAYVDVSGLGSLGSYGDQKPIPIGSVAKTMTAYIIMRDHPLKQGKEGPKIRVDRQAEEDGKKGAGHGDESVLDTVEEGDRITQKQALSAVMIPSANNIARLLARWDAGSQEAFVKKMNATAKELGMKNTTYTDPSGLIETTVSTAEDQVKLGKKAMEMPALVDITKLPSWTDPSGKTWRNYNTLPPYNNAIGLKTGSTSKAGGNLLFAGRQQVGGTTQLIVGAVLGQHRPPIIDTANAVSKDLLTTAQSALEDRTVVKKGDVVGVVDDGLGGTTPVVATEDVKAVGWNGLTVKLALTDNGKAIPHEATAGTKVGSLTVGSGPGQVKVPVALQEDLAEPSFGAKLTRLG